MKILITGINGTIGSELKKFLVSQGHEVIGWNRSEIPIDNYSVMLNYVNSVQPDAVYHLAIASKPTGKENESWLVNYEWTSELAWITKILNIKFIFVSSALVFSDFAVGPFTVYSEPDATDGYGYEKRMAEKRSVYQNSNSVILRLGWQIGKEPDSNNMIDFIEREMKEKGEIRASTKWFPACSFLEDTVLILDKSREYFPGIYQVDSNKKWTFYEIVSALNILHGNKWKIVSTEEFVFDQRLIDDRIHIKSLNSHLKTLH